MIMKTRAMVCTDPLYCKMRQIIVEIAMLLQRLQNHLYYRSDYGSSPEFKTMTVVFLCLEHGFVLFKCVFFTLTLNITAKLVS